MTHWGNKDIDPDQTGTGGALINNTRVKILNLLDTSYLNSLFNTVIIHN